MPGHPAWRATPRGRRSISEAATALGVRRSERCRLVLVVGAGVDQSLSGRPGWSELLSTLGSGLRLDKKSKRGLSNAAGQWPMETAEALRLTLGPQEFTTGLRNALPTIDSQELVSEPIAKAVIGLVKAGVGVILSLNYTDDLAAVLRQNLGSRFVRVIDRSELSAWQLGRLLGPPPREVHIVKLHGSVPITDGFAAPVVLDRSSYDAALLADSPYRGVLSRIFEDFIVLSIGVSWTDVPLRDAAARARRLLPVARAMHYATRQHSGLDAADWWEERALTSSYGLRPLYYDSHDEVPEVVEAIVDLARPENEPSPNSDLSAIAHWLDQVGDYESQQQSNWFAKHWRAVSATLNRASEGTDLTPDMWLDCARIERHLRHFVWFWLAPGQREKHRRNIWLRIALGWEALPDIDRDHIWQQERISNTIKGQESLTGDNSDRALFEFAMGAYEIFGEEARDHKAVTPWVERLRGMRRARKGIAARRITVAEKVWSSRTPSDLHLVHAAREAGWEGMEAKVALDIVQKALMENANRLGTPRDWPGSLRDPLWRRCEHARELSRVAGCNRREAGAIVLASFLAPTDQAESDLIAAYRRLRDLSGGRLEPTAAWSVLIGLIAVFSDQAGNKQNNDLIPALCGWLRDKCGEIPTSKAQAAVVERNYAKHWGLFHGPAAQLAPQVAKYLLWRAP